MSFNTTVRWITDTIFGGRASRVEKDANGDFFYVVGGSNIDLPFKTNLEIYKGIPHLRSIVEKHMSFFANARFKIIRTDTEEEEVDYDHQLNTILTNPNSWQSWRDMLAMVCLYKLVGGCSFIYPGFGLVRRASGLAFLKPVEYETFDVVENTQFNPLITNDPDELVTKYRFWLRQGRSLEYKPSDLIRFPDSSYSYIDNFSRITSNIKPIENIYKALVNRGILMDAKGGIGLISGSQKDGGVSVPLRKSEKKKINSRLDDYGLGKGKQPIILTDVPLKYTPMIFPTNSLMLFEEIVDDFNTLCDSFGMARELFVGDAAYAATRAQAERETYENTIVPEWESYFDLLNDKLGMVKEKRKIVLDTEHIGCLNKSESEKEDALIKKQSRLEKDLILKAIDIEQYKQMMGYETTKK